MKSLTHKSLYEGTSSETIEDSQGIAINAGFLILIAFAILRPLSLMGKENLAIGAVEITELMGIGISYLLILPLLTRLKQIKLDLLTLFIFTFVLYCMESIIWGSEIRKAAKTILPFIVFFSIRTIITDVKQLRVLLIFLVIGFLIPIALSTYNIVLGKSIQMIEWHNKMPRFAGVFTGVHVLSYSMLFFSFLYCILKRVYKLENIFNRIVIAVLVILSAYCLYKSLTRTVMIGFILFWLIYLWGIDKKTFFVAVLLLAVVGVAFSEHIHSIVFKTNEFDLNIATSGRVSLFSNNINLFLESSLTDKLFGHGLGREQKFLYHNDYIALLLEIGIIGLSLYFILLIYLFRDVFLCKDKKTKYLFSGILISIFLMNFGSNAVVFRFELSQYFWMIMGIFYIIKNDEKYKILS